MSRFTPNQLRAAIGGQWVNTTAGEEPFDVPVSGGAVSDSRAVEPGDIFWTLPGESRHGHEFIADAWQRGAAGVVTDSLEIAATGRRWGIAVKDPQRALWQAAAWQRREFDGTAIAVTGSVGKTTTRELIHQVLAARYAGTASKHNYNNHVGLPLSMLGWTSDDDYAVVELGANQPGEIGALADLCRPQIGLITRIGEAHLGGFGGMDGVAAAKAELLEKLPADGWAVLNGDDTQLRRLAPHCGARITWVGRGADNDLVATDVHSWQGKLEFSVGGERLSANACGRHHLTGVLMAVAMGQAWGMSLDEIGDALSHFTVPAQRGYVLNMRGASVIDDTYNANPTSMRAALEVLRDFDAPGRRIFVCGDMLELGDATTDLHRRLGDEVVTLCGADLLIACGDHAAEVIEGARAAGMPSRHALACHDAEQAASEVQRVLRGGDVVLVKGSRAMAMERCVQLLDRGLRTTPTLRLRKAA